MDSRLWLHLAVVPGLLFSVAVSAGPATSWIYKMKSPFPRPDIKATVTPAERYTIGDTITATGVVLTEMHYTTYGALSGCNGFFRRDDGKIISYKVKAFSFSGMLALHAGDPGIYGTTTPCGLLSAGVASQKPVTISGTVTQLSTTDSSGRSLSGILLLNRVEMRDADFDIPDSPSNAALSEISSGGTMAGGLGTVKRVVAWVNQPDKFCEASVANDGGFYRVRIEPPEEMGDETVRASRPDNWEAIESVTGHSMVRTCDLLIQSTAFGIHVHGWGEQTSPAELVNPEITLMAPSMTYGTSLSTTLF